ncbi:glycosyltransferase [Frondihabitans cladoniiphilus]|uniref:Glycosyl transferase family 1 domain-containing protein n=1 Tax=Frondihabitans cladoniiphilus TaxID=715785 RepID=A0ABP8W4D3_9MICO
MPDGAEGLAMKPSGRRALLVVEPRFAQEHVGVRRVIVDYWERLLARGFEVELAVVHQGVLALVDAEAAARTRIDISRRSSGMTSPAWSTATARAGHAHPTLAPSLAAEQPLDLSTALVGWVRAADFDVSLLSNPWLCDQLMPSERFTHGVVYDLVPNLLAAQAMDFGTPNWPVTGFAHSHHRGYEFFLDHVDTILCISTSTRDDFLRYYEPDEGTAVVVDVPFDLDRFLADYRDVETVDAPGGVAGAARILLVNVLDPRKNIEQVTRALSDLSRTRPLSIEIVGNSRLSPGHAPEDYFERLSENGAAVTWYRGASDELLVALYRSCDVLLFPSLYEGLGLPILEAQSFGLPAISGSGSSLGQINFNPSLFVEPTDAKDVARGVTAFLDKTAPIVSGPELVAANRAFLEAHHTFEASLPD